MVLKWDAPHVTTCSAPVLRSYPPEALCFLPGGGRDGADGWEDEPNDKKALEKDRKEGKGPGVPPSVGIITSAWHRSVTQSNAMSSSRQHSESRAIPTRTVLIDDSTQLPHDYCTTPGGTLFSTTPGGNVILKRAFCYLNQNSCVEVCHLLFSSLCSTLACGLLVSLKTLASSKQKQGLDFKWRPTSCIGSLFRV